MALDRDIQLKLLAAVYKNPQTMHFLRACPEGYFHGRERELREKILAGVPLKRSEVIALDSANADPYAVDAYAAELIEEGYLSSVHNHLDVIAQAYKEKDSNRLQDLLYRPPNRPSTKAPLSAPEQLELELKNPIKFTYELPDVLAPLRNYWGKLMPGAIQVIAADNGVGKSLLLEQLGLHFAMRGEPVQDYSAEMPFLNRVFRYLHHLKGSDYDIKRYFDGLIPQEDLTDARKELPPTLFIHQPRSRREMIAHAERMHLDRGVNIFMVDFLQALAHGSGDRKYQEIASTIEDIYEFTLRYPTVWLVAAQYNRSGKAAQREDRQGNKGKPNNSDLHGANEIETYAWNITHLAREDEFSGERKVYITKNRFGVNGETTLGFDDEHLVFKLP